MKEAATCGGVYLEPIARLGYLHREIVRGVTGIKMPETRKYRLLQWAGSRWPPFLIGFGVIAVIAWTTVLGWLIIKAFQLIL